MAFIYMKMEPVSLVIPDPFQAAGVIGTRAINLMEIMQETFPCFSQTMAIPVCVFTNRFNSQDIGRSIIHENPDDYRITASGNSESVLHVVL